jgi:hypothetical protein
MQYLLARMHSRIQLSLIIWFAVGSGYCAMPESEWLLDAVNARFSSLDEVGMNIEKLRNDFSDPASIAKLKSLLQKLSANPHAIDGLDVGAGRAAFQLLTAANAPGIAEIALPILRNPQHPLRPDAAQAAAVARDDRAVDLLEQAALGHKAAFSLPASTRTAAVLEQQQEAFDYLRCLALLGTPKATSAFDRASSQLLAAAGTGSPEARDRVTEAVDELKSAMVRAARTAAPAALPRATTPVAQTPAVTVEQRTPMWPWVVGILALAVVVALAWKRRA